MNNGFTPNADETRVPSGQRQKSLYGGQMVTPTPLVAFGGDIAIPAASSIVVDIQQNMGARCTGFIISSIFGTVQYSINGGGLRTCPSALAVNDAQINSLLIVTGVGSTCILQLHGV